MKFTSNQLLSEITSRLTRSTVSKTKLVEICKILGINTNDKSKTVLKDDANQLNDDKIKFYGLVNDIEQNRLEADKQQVKKSINVINSSKDIKPVVVKKPKTTVKPSKDIKPVVVKKLNPWIEHLKNYKEKHPDATHKVAMVEAKKTYQKAEKQAKIKKEVISEYKCPMCDYTTSDKSNYNRHLIADRNTLIKKTMAQRGIIRTALGRMNDRSRDTDYRAEYEQKHEEAVKKHDEYVNILKFVENGNDITKITQADIVKMVARKRSSPNQKVAKNTARLPSSLIEKLNVSFKADNDGQNLNLSKENIGKVNKLINGYQVELKNFEVDGEKIDELVFDNDNTDEYYVVSFNQRINHPQLGNRMSEIDSVTIYQ